MSDHSPSADSTANGTPAANGSAAAGGSSASNGSSAASGSSASNGSSTASGSTASGSTASGDAAANGHDARPQAAQPIFEPVGDPAADADLLGPELMPADLLAAQLRAADRATERASGLDAALEAGVAAGPASGSTAGSAAGGASSSAAGAASGAVAGSTAGSAAGAASGVDAGSTGEPAAGRLTVARPSFPELALGTAMLAADRIRQLAGQMQQQLGRAVTSTPRPADPAAPATGDPVHPGPDALLADALPADTLPADAAHTGWPDDAVGHPGPNDAVRAPATLAVGLASQGVDFMRNTSSRVYDGARAQSNRFSASVSAGVNTPIDRARDAVSSASARGRDSIAASREAAARTLRGALDDSIIWAETNIVPKVVDDLMPYLVNSVVPRLIDGAMPQIRAKVIPVVIEDLTADPRIRELIAEQGRGMLSDATDELRSTSASADDAVEASFRKLFHLTPGTDR